MGHQYMSLTQDMGLYEMVGGEAGCKVRSSTRVENFESRERLWRNSWEWRWQSGC